MEIRDRLFQDPLDLLTGYVQGQLLAASARAAGNVALVDPLQLLQMEVGLNSLTLTLLHHLAQLMTGRAAPGYSGTSAPVSTAPASTVAPVSGGGGGPADDVGSRALSFGVDSPAVNRNTGDTNWYTWCLGWVNQAIEWAGGGKIPELQAGDAQEAYEKALAAGKIHYGNPPRGAIVFFPGIVNPANGDVWGHVGISNGDGTYRGTVPASESPSQIGDRPIKDIGSIPWMYPR